MPTPILGPRIPEQGMPETGGGAGIEPGSAEAVGNPYRTTSPVWRHSTSNPLAPMLLHAVLPDPEAEVHPFAARLAGFSAVQAANLSIAQRASSGLAEAIRLCHPSRSSG